MSMFEIINLVAVAGTALLMMAVHTVWYSSMLFGSTWAKVAPVVENAKEHFTKPYLDCGFFIEGRHSKEYFMDGEWRDEIRMACFLEDWRGTLK